MKIAFFGLPQFGAFFLKRLVAQKQEIGAIVTNQSRPNPLVEIGEKLHIPVYRVTNKRDFGYLDALERCRPDICIVASFTQIFPKEVLEVPKRGFLNIHASLLPKYRGPQPLERQIMNGEKYTGITIHFMEEKVDSGPIVAQEKLEILFDDTIQSLFLKLSRLGNGLLSKALEDIDQGTNQAIPQNEQEASYFPHVTFEERRIDWTKPSLEIYNLVRALYPEISAYTSYQDEKILVLSGRIVNTSCQAGSGTIMNLQNNSMTIVTGDQAFEVLRYQFDSKTLPPLKIGARLGY